MQHLPVINCLLPVICCNFNLRMAKVILKRQTPYMNTRILLLIVSIAAFSSCSVYRSGQTPDDVYYSPARVQPEQNEYVEVRQEKPGTNYQSYEQYQDSYRDDRFLRMSIRNPYYMNMYNSYSGFDWRYNSFYDGFNYGFNSPWNNYFAWNNFYNPYALSFGSYYGGGYGGYYGGGYGGGYYAGGGYYGGGTHYPINTAPISRPRVFNVNSYSNNNRTGARTYSNGSYYNNSQQRYNNGNSSGNRTYYNNTNNSNNRSMYTPSNSSNNNSSPSRSYTPSSSGGSSSGSSSGGGGGVSRPSRGN